MNKNYTTLDIGVVAIFDDKEQLVGIIHRDSKSGKNVCFNVNEMSTDEIAEFIGRKQLVNGEIKG